MSGTKRAFENGADGAVHIPKSPRLCASQADLDPKALNKVLGNSTGFVRHCVSLLQLEFAAASYLPPASCASCLLPPAPPAFCQPPTLLPPASRRMPAPCSCLCLLRQPAIVACVLSMRCSFFAPPGPVTATFIVGQQH